MLHETHHQNLRVQYHHFDINYFIFNIINGTVTFCTISNFIYFFCLIFFLNLFEFKIDN